MLTINVQRNPGVWRIGHSLSACNIARSHRCIKRPRFRPEVVGKIEEFDRDGDGKLTIAEVQELVKELQQLQPSATTAVPKPPAPPGPMTWSMQISKGLSDSVAQGGALAALMSYMHVKITNKHRNKVLLSDMVWSFLGMFLAVAALGFASQAVKAWPVVGPWHQQGLNLLLGSFGTICVLLFGRPDAEAIKMWNLVVGHLLSVAVVITIINVLGPSILSRALAMACAIVAMLWTDSVHPPGGALVLMFVDSKVMQGMQAWFVLYPSLLFTFAMLLPLGLLCDTLKRKVKFDWPTAVQQQQQGGGPHSNPSDGGMRLKAA